MAGHVVCNVGRVNHAIVDALAMLGVATVDDAQRQIGLIGSRLRPIHAVKRIAGSAVTISAPGNKRMIHVAIEQLRSATSSSFRRPARVGTLS